MAVSLPILDPSPTRPHYAQGPRSLDAVKLLRMSVTDRCNFRCLYCMPEDGVPFAQKSDILSAADLLAVARAAAQVGVTHFKITGGEPTVRGDLLDIVAGLRSIGAQDISMTTNAVRLPDIARSLREAGLDRLTVSLDSMRPGRLASITRGGAETLQDGHRRLDAIRRGINAAMEAGFAKLKLNVVVIGGINDDEVADFARLTQRNPWTVRFIEYMPLGDSTLVDEADLYTVDNAAVRERIAETLGPLHPIDREGEAGVGPATLYRLDGAPGKLGFISAMSRPFCESCNRLRLTATGELRSCLFDGGEVSVLPALRPKPDAKRIVEAMAECVAMKPDVHSHRGNRAMSQLGG